MHGLRELQLAFGDGLFEPGQSGVAALVRGNGLDGDRRLNVYRNNVFSSLTEALGAVHPVVRKLVGSGFFAYCADSYIRAHPSTSGNLHAFGSGFGEFLRTFEPAGELHYLPDVARFEWLYHEAYHAADHPPLDTGRLDAVDPEHYAGLRLLLHPACRLFASQYPVLAIWRANQDDTAGDDPISLDSGGVHLLISRAEEPEFHPVDAAEFAWLKALAAGRDLGAAVAAALAVRPDFDLQHSLARRVAQGIIVDFR